MKQYRDKNYHDIILITVAVLQVLMNIRGMKYCTDITKFECF